MENDQNKSNQQPKFDKTFVESSEEEQQPHPLQTGTKINLTSGSVQTAYGGKPTGNLYDMLPSGDEPIEIGSGKIAGVLGAGGMAKVYKIWNERLEVFRAVKILMPSQQSDLMNRFETEAKITAKLHHTNIVEIYNVGDWQGLPFLEMEFVDGPSLEFVIAKHDKLPETVSCAIAIFIARSLAYAHSQKFLIYGKNYNGIVHRDLKPANVMIARDGTVKLMDFGIARPTETSLHTVEGNIVGTLPYLAPEQIDGVDIDGRVDIYACGTILYEMLTGTKTFPQNSITNLMKNKITNEYRKFDDFDYKMHTGLTRVAQKCLEVEKRNRYTDARALLQALETSLRTITSDTPEEVVRQYIQDPDSIVSISRGKKILLLKPKFLAPIGGAIAVFATIIIFLMTGPSLNSDRPNKPETAKSTKEVAQKVPAPAMPTQKNETLTPLAAAQKDTPPKKVLKEKPETTPQRTVTRKPRPKPAPRPRPKPAKSPLDKLKAAYGSQDLVSAGESALQQDKYNDAILALKNVESNHPQRQKKTILLLEAYIKAGRTGDALLIINSERIRDAQFDFLAGQTYYKLGKLAAAVKHFDDAATKPSNYRSRGAVLKDALYYAALSRGGMHSSKPDESTRKSAMNAWKAVVQTYRTNSSHPRFIKASNELNRLASIH
ncbi:MAG: protein kinase [Chitinivibrionales bacterium]|nr:protein kinase [Chitinivibrionales bacterium]